MTIDEQLAATLIAGPWERREMIARIAHVTSLPEDADWVVALVDDVREGFAVVPDEEELLEWLEDHGVLDAEPEIRLRRWPAPPLEVPGGLATWLGFDVAQLEARLEAAERGARRRLSSRTIYQQLAATLIDGPWERRPMIGRLAHLTNLADDERWIVAVVEAAHGEFAEVPEPEELVDWLHGHELLGKALAGRTAVRIRRWPKPPLEMAESPWPVPALASHGDLATWLGLDVAQLEDLADERGIARNARDPRRRHYRYTWVAKRSGGHRLLEAPKPRLRAVQRYVLDDIVARIPPHAAAHGFRAGHSIAGFATPHVGREVVIRLDLQAFFSSVSRPRVGAMFRAAGYPDPIARVLDALCTHRTPRDVLAAAPSRVWSELAMLRGGHLPQGAPTSGALANLAAYGLDVRVDALAAALGARYTRYADDLVISGPRSLTRAASSIVGRVGAIAHEEGFALNFRKTRVMTAGDRQRITGLVVNAKLAVARDDVDRLRATLFNCVRTGPAGQNREGVADFRAHLLGRISWIGSFDRGKGVRLRALFDRIRWDADEAERGVR